MNRELITKLRNVKLFVLDMDGVLTDGGIYLMSSGEQARKFNAKDGEGLKRLQRKNIQVAILTGSKEAEIVLKRSKMLSIPEEFVSYNTSNKLEVLKKWCTQKSITLKEVAYMGDDLPDIPVLQNVGFSACPNDAEQKVIEVCDYHCTKNGGEGCVREVINSIIH